VKLIDKRSGEVVFDGRRVSNSLPCSICGHLHKRQSWCVVDVERGLTICPRVESKTRIGNAGWLHGTETNANRIGNQSAISRQGERVVVNMAQVWRTMTAATAVQVRELALRLKLPESFVQCVETKFFNGAFAFAMHNALDTVCGVKYRRGDNKFSATGSRTGYIPCANYSRENNEVWITEGESDLMVAAGFGLNAVARSGCMNSSEALRSVCRQRNVVIVADNDKAGVSGARAFAAEPLGARSVAVVIPPTKDLRDWYTRDKISAQDLRYCWKAVRGY